MPLNTTLTPMPGYALVTLDSQYKSGLSTEKEKYGTNTSGRLVRYQFKHTDTTDLNYMQEVEEEYGDLTGRTVYFAAFQDGEPIQDNGYEYVFIPLDEIRGVRL